MCPALGRLPSRCQNHTRILCFFQPSKSVLPLFSKEEPRGDFINSKQLHVPCSPFQSPLAPLFQRGVDNTSLVKREKDKTFLVQWGGNRDRNCPPSRGFHTKRHRPEPR